ncbi:MAG: homoserine dehydrogenase [Lactobacillus sp.]|jgi:homoserine dehydrogenase|nr:homoserine dehydrogenase [Lactobacillus sp.]
MRTIKVGLLGLGTVGSGVLRILTNNQAKITQTAGCQLEPAKALVRNPAKHAAAAEQIQLVTDFGEIANDQSIALVVEAMGGIHPAKEYITALLQAKKSVETANKDLIASCGPELVRLARDNGVALRYEASVAGGIPILNTLAQSFAGDEITQVAGIVNGTTNYILTQMAQQHSSFAAALKQAQQLGFAEADPTNDVTGKDAAFKMVILTKFAFGTDVKIADFNYQGIEDVQAFDVEQAADLGYVIKLVGISRKQNGEIFVEVAPTLVPQTSQLAQVNNEYNAVAIESMAVGRSFFYGPGAGSLPTANSIVSDLIAEASAAHPTSFNKLDCQLPLAGPAEVVDPYYLSLLAGTKTTELALAQLVTEQKLETTNLQAIGDAAGHHLILTTKPMSRLAVDKFIKAAQAVKISVDAAYKILE